MKWPVQFKTEKCDIYIGRPSKWGCPFSILMFRGSREDTLEHYEGWLLSNVALMKLARRELKGKVLGCFCFPLLCHGDFLTRIANDWQLNQPLEID